MSGIDHGTASLVARDLAVLLVFAGILVSPLLLVLGVLVYLATSRTSLRSCRTAGSSAEPPASRPTRRLTVSGPLTEGAGTFDPA